jgi:hypothetical protein
MTEWTTEIPLLQDPYQGQLTRDERLAALQRALEEFQTTVASYQSLVDAIRSCMAGIRQEMARGHEVDVSTLSEVPSCHPIDKIDCEPICGV